MTAGTTVEFSLGTLHQIHFAAPDSSWLPDINSSSASTLQLRFLGRARIAGGLFGYGLDLTGDTLVTDDQLSSGPAGLSVALDRYEGPVFDQFQNVSNWTVTTTQFTGDGGLPFSGNFAFDTLIVSANVGGQLSQLLTANYVEVTGPGDPRHIGGSVGGLILSGGDGNTTLNVSGDVLVRGAGAHISSFEGQFSATGDLTVDQDGYLYSTGSFGGAGWTVDGDVVIDGASTADSLVKGSLSIGGNFTQLATSSGSSWAPDSNFMTQFTGGGTHVVTFATPSAAGGGGSYFGSLTFDPVAGVVMQTAGDLWVEGLLQTVSYTNPVLQNTGPVLHTINVRDVSIQGITFDHLQLKLAKTGLPSLGGNNMDIVNFNNFLTTEDQFVVALPGLSGPFTWSNFTFTQLDTGGGDSGHYIVATDNDGGLPNVLLISIGTNQSGDPSQYFLGLLGAIVTPFSP